MIKPIYKKCDNKDCTKNGFVRGKQRYICKHCSTSFVLGDERGKHLLDPLSGLRVHFFCADHYEAYQALTPVDKLYLGKDKTHVIERNSCLQRHWLVRFKQKFIVVSKPVKMVDMSIALFAAIHINKNWAGGVS